jgi:hypothetical protein
MWCDGARSLGEWDATTLCKGFRPWLATWTPDGRAGTTTSHHGGMRRLKYGRVRGQVATGRTKVGRQPDLSLPLRRASLIAVQPQLRKIERAGAESARRLTIEDIARTLDWGSRRATHASVLAEAETVGGRSHSRARAVGER